jgi:hypothetical protein
VKEMLVVGTVSSAEEQREVRIVAEIWLIGERIRYIARQQNTPKKIKKK